MVNNLLEAFDTKWLFGDVSATCLLSAPRMTLMEDIQTERCDMHTGFKSPASGRLRCPHLNLIHSN